MKFETQCHLILAQPNVKYLSINLMECVQELLNEENYKTLMREIKELKNWRDTLHSVLSGIIPLKIRNEKEAHCVFRTVKVLCMQERMLSQVCPKPQNVQH